MAIRQFKITQTITNRTEASIDRYLIELNREGLITTGEEIDLAKKIKNGDKQALEQLVKANLRFVVSVAKQYQNRGLTLSDLIQEGNDGLIIAAQRFDETRGFKFISYAVWHIRQCIMFAISENSRMVRLPINKINLLNKLYQASSKLEQNLEREPSAEELSEVIDLSKDKINDLFSVAPKHFSLDSPVNSREDDERSLLNVLEDKDSPATDSKLLKDSLKLEIDRTLETLKGRENEVIRMAFGIGIPYPLSMSEIGVKFELTPARVRQIKDKAIRRLRNSSQSKILKPYL